MSEMCLRVFASPRISEFTDPDIARCWCARSRLVDDVADRVDDDVGALSMDVVGGVRHGRQCGAGDGRGELMIRLAERLEYRILKVCRVVGRECVADEDGDRHGA